MREHHLLSVKSVERVAANTLFKANLDAAGGEKTFSIPTYKIADATDALPDRYWCATKMTPAIQALWLTLRVQITTMTDTIYDPDIDPAFPETFLVQRGLRRGLLT